MGWSFVTPEAVEITESRWDVRITIRDSEGVPHEFVASADRFYTDGDSIRFGTKEEHEQETS